jgi:2'-5' RNA ligase
MEIYSSQSGSAILMMLPKDFSDKVIKWGKKHISKDKLSGLPNKGYEGSPHITLCTGIIDTEPEKAFDILQKNGPFVVTLGEVDCFRKSAKNYDVIKLDIDSEVLKKLNRQVLDTVEVNDPVATYKPHITIAYTLPHACDGLLGNDEFAGMEVPIEGFVLADREKGGKVIKFRKGEPLKESLDYGIADVASFLGGKGLVIGRMSSLDIGRTILAMQK